MIVQVVLGIQQLQQAMTIAGVQAIQQDRLLETAEFLNIEAQRLVDAKSVGVAQYPGEPRNALVIMHNTCACVQEHWIVETVACRQVAEEAATALGTA